MLTNYQIKILEIGHRHRLFATRHVVKLLGSEQYPLRCVPALATMEYLLPVEWSREAPTEGYRAYQLGRKAPGPLSKALGVSEDEIRVRRKPIDKRFIEHELMITDIMVGFEAAAEIVPLGSQSLAGEVWHAGEPIKLEIDTDYSFTMDVDGKPRTYHVEADRAKEPAYRKNIKTQRSIYQKLLVYKERWSPQNRFQVLIVTTTERKARRLAEMAQNRIDWKGYNRNLVLFGWPNDNP